MCVWGGGSKFLLGPLLDTSARTSVWARISRNEEEEQSCNFREWFFTCTNSPNSGGNDFNLLFFNCNWRMQFNFPINFGTFSNFLLLKLTTLGFDLRAFKSNVSAMMFVVATLAEVITM